MRINKKIRNFQILILFFCFIKPLTSKANPIKGISDFDRGFKGIERIDFECPPNPKKKILRIYQELDDQQPPQICWVDFHKTFLNVMDKQIIDRNNVLRFFQSPPSSGKCCASWNLIYRDKESKTRILSMRRNDLPFPLTKRKLKRLGTPANIINRWLAQ